MGPRGLVPSEQLPARSEVKARVDSGYQGLAKKFPGQVTAPPKKPKEEACDGDKWAWREARRRQSLARICVEQTNAELRQWAPLRRFTGRRETFCETQRAVATLVSDRAAKRPTHREHSTELVLCPRHRLLITHQPNRQASKPRTQSQVRP